VELGFMPGILGILRRLGKEHRPCPPAVEAKTLGLGVD
jgi:hypothetical protein